MKWILPVVTLVVAAPPSASAVDRTGRVVETMRLALPRGAVPVGVARHADRVSFVVPGTTAFGRRFGVVDLRSRRARILTWGAGPRSWAAGGQFSPDGSKLLIRRWRKLVAVDVHTGRVTLVATDPSPRPFEWLDDGRVAFIDRGGRFRAVRVGSAATSLGFTLPSGASAEITWSPNGRFVLYGHRCAVHLVDLRTGRTRSLRSHTAGFDAAPGPWAPDGKHFVLPRGFWEHGCRSFGRYPQTTATVHDLVLRRVAVVAGFSFTWKPDDSVLVTTGGTTGNAVGLSQGASVFSLRHRRRAIVFVDRVNGRALLTRGGWLVYQRFAAAATDRNFNEFAPVPVYASLLTLRRRR